MHTFFRGIEEPMNSNGRISIVVPRKNSLRFYALLAAIGYTILASLLIPTGSLGILAWAAAPAGVSGLLVLWVSDAKGSLFWLIVQAILLVPGAPILIWGLAINPGLSNHLVALFLPIYQFAFMIIAGVGFRLIQAIKS